MSLRIAKVVATYPDSRTVDLVFTDTGLRVARVQVGGDASSDSGGWSIPSVPKPRSEAAPDTIDPKGRNLYALVGNVGIRPVVINFLHPQGTQMTFKEDDRTVHRHPSGAYSTVAPDGSIETFHPSGAFLRIGTGGHQDLAAVSADGNWSIPAGAPLAQVTLATAGFTLTILPNGSTTLETTGQLVMTYHDAVLTGDIKLNGNLVATGDVTANGVSLDHHTHGDPQGGNTEPPNP